MSVGTQPLSDIKVIDLTQGIAGPYATKLLADYGAEVLKIERPPSGDPSRTFGPFPNNQEHPEKSGSFLLLNTNKQSMVVDLKKSQGTDILKALISTADLVIENFRPGVMDQLGLGQEALKSINIKLTLTSISNFGQTGPYRDYKASELTLFAMGGVMNRNGLLGRPPLKLGGNHVQYQAGNIAAMASMFSLFNVKHHDGDGQYIDVAIFETQAASYNARMPMLLAYQYTGERTPRTDVPGSGFGYPAGFYPCQDGYVNITGGGAFWPRTVALLGMPELLNDPRFAPPMGQVSPEGREIFETEIWIPWLLERTKLQIVEQCQQYEILSGAFNTIDEVMDQNPQFEARNYWQTIDHPEAGSFRYPGAPSFTSEKWWQVRSPAPLLGEHTRSILTGHLGYSDTSIEDLVSSGIVS
jgi:crotonobetainyl-CoA:carnitine CoA-transferase CaiB-like acyl-CoA transferase